MDENGRQPDSNLEYGSVTPIMSQGTLETMMDLTGVNTSDFDCLLLKSEILPDFQQETTYSLETDQHIPEMYQYEPLPDSTEQFVMPVSTSALPSTENYSGPCNFEVDLIKTDDKTKWQYSKLLNKLFVVMNSKIPLSFKWTQSENGLYVRVLPIFLQQDSFAEPVRRCPAHESPKEVTNKDFVHVSHVIRCHHANTMYHKNPTSHRFSVLVPLEHPQPGTDFSTMIFSFMCKNSCCLGMNRRSTALIFTLERSNGEVIGRKMINIRICSCPRRDMAKEEQDHKMKDKLETPPEEPLDCEEVHKVPINKKPLKRLTNLQIRVPKSHVKSIVKIIKETIVISENGRELTPEEQIMLEDCNKYLS